MNTTGRRHGRNGLHCSVRTREHKKRGGPEDSFYNEVREEGKSQGVKGQFRSRDPRGNMGSQSEGKKAKGGLCSNGGSKNGERGKQRGLVCNGAKTGGDYVAVICQRRQAQRGTRGFAWGTKKRTRLSRQSRRSFSRGEKRREKAVSATRTSV